MLPVVFACVVSACSGGSDSPASPSPGTLTKPTIDSPAEGAQLDSLRPTLTIVNISSSQGGAKTYEFEISESSATGQGNAFTTRTFLSPAITEDPSGKTKMTLSQDLQPSTRYYWHARLVQGGSTSDWSETRSFKTRIAGFNRQGALYDPLFNGETIGTISGNTTWVPGQGIRLNDARAYVVYELAQVLRTGELSVEVTGLGPGGPCCKPRVFTIIDRTTGLASSSEYSMNAQYRGIGGNPDNGIAWKAIFGDNDEGLEPTTSERIASVYVLDPTKVYLWQGIWTTNSYRVVVREGSATGPLIYDFGKGSPTANWNPARMFAFLGTHNGQFDPADGTLAGITLKNLWVGSTSRPASLGSATAPAR